jgi:hypothetical protein
MAALRPFREPALLQIGGYPEYFFLQTIHCLRFLPTRFFAVQNGSAGGRISAGAKPMTVAALSCHCPCSFGFLVSYSAATGS